MITVRRRPVEPTGEGDVLVEDEHIVRGLE